MMKFTCFLFSEAEGTWLTDFASPFLPFPTFVFYIRTRVQEHLLLFGVSSRTKSCPWIPGPKLRKGREGTQGVSGVGKQKDGETRGQAKTRTGERKRKVLSVGTGKRTMHPFCTGSKDSSSWGSGSNPFPGLILCQFVLGPAILPLGMSCFRTRQLFCKLHRLA